MNVLGFDTATAVTSACVLRNGDAFESPLSAPDWIDVAPEHSAELMPAIEGCLAAAGLAYTDLDRLAVGVGPGAFTGLRIGVATARALAQALGLKISPVSTLRTIAAALADSSRDVTHVMPVIDAKRGEVFYALYQVGNGDLIELWEEAADPPDQLASRLRAEPPADLLLAGDGAIRYRSELTLPGSRIPEPASALHLPRSLYTCRLAASVEPLHPEAIEPTYIRLPDAELRIRRGNLTKDG